MKKLNLEDFDEIYEILRDSFPEDERRDYAEQKKLMQRKEYVLIGKKNEEEIAGFIALWDFDCFAYIEHFAVKECYRNRKLGEMMLKEAAEMYNKPIALEVELPENEIAKRRIDFYKRNGFCFNDFDYVQLPYSEDRKPVPLRIMSYPDELREEDYLSVRNTIYKELFGVEV